MSATALVTEFLLAAEEGNVDALKACLEKGVDIKRHQPPEKNRHYYCQPEKALCLCGIFNCSRCGY